MKPFHRSEVHRRQLKKNIAVLAIIAGVCVMIWVVTMIKIGGG